MKLYKVFIGDGDRAAEVDDSHWYHVVANSIAQAVKKVEGESRRSGADNCHAVRVDLVASERIGFIK